MTTEENWNKQQERSKKVLKSIPCIKGYSQKFMIFIHIMRVELCRICYNISTQSVIIV